MPHPPEEILQRIIDRNTVKSKVVKGDANYGDYVETEYKGRKQKFKIGGNGSSFGRNG